MKTYTLHIINESKNKSAKMITKKATIKNLETMLKMTMKLKFAKNKMISYIHDSNHKDIAYITNNNYYKY